jgi:hypothetical protein
MQERMLDGRSEEEYLATAERIGPYLTLQGGIAFERGNLQWCEAVLTWLEQRAAVRDGKADG